MLKWMVIGAAGFLGFKAWQKKVAAENISVNFSALKSFKLDILRNKLEITAIINITNPSSESLSINHIAGYATLDSINLGEFVTQAATINISPRGTTRVDIPITFNLLNLASQALQVVTTILKGGSFSKPFAVNSVINVFGINVPLQFTTTLSSNLLTV